MHTCIDRKTQRNAKHRFSHCIVSLAKLMILAHKFIFGTVGFSRFLLLLPLPLLWLGCYSVRTRFQIISANVLKICGGSILTIVITGRLLLYGAFFLSLSFTRFSFHKFKTVLIELVINKTQIIVETWNYYSISPRSQWHRPRHLIKFQICWVVVIFFFHRLLYNRQFVINTNDCD